MSHETVSKKCAEPSCSNTVKDHAWGMINSGDWFHQKDGRSWCPDHIPEWVARWRAKKVSKA